MLLGGLIMGVFRNKCICRLAILTISLLVSGSLLAVPKAKTIGYWDSSNEQSTRVVDHSALQKILDKYVDPSHPSGVSRVDYQNLKDQGLKELASYLEHLAQQTPKTLNKKEQKAFWLNLYNAGMLYIVAANFPIESVQQIKPGKIKFITVDDQLLTLNNIEHGILRPIYMDNRIHFGFSCGSIGCPSIPSEAFTSSNIDKQLKKLGSNFVNHSRGVRKGSNKVFMSKIFDWYLSDFGGSKEALLEYIKFYANPDLKQKLDEGPSIEFIKHDWELNKAD